MIALIVFFVVVFLVAIGFAWLADQPGSLLVFRIGGFEFAEENLAIIAAICLAVLLLIIFTWIVITAIWKTPSSIGGFFGKRRRDKGWRAVADGMIAVGAGDLSAATKYAKNSSKYLPEEPVTKLLSAQTAQMAGKSDEARAAFEAMIETPETRVVGYRGLYLEAEKVGETEAARQFVEKAVETRPGLEWSGTALLEMQAGSEDWASALVTLSQNTDAKLYTKPEAKRLRAVLLTAYADALEDSEPQKAKEKALEAHRLAPDLVPSATIAARVLSRLGDLKKASKIVETAWKKAPHPQLMDVYTHLRAGDSGQDRLKRAQNLMSQRAHHPEGIMGVARAHMDLQNWDEARKMISGLLKSAPTERVCLMMSEIEEGEYGDRGRVREWLARAVRAPRDPVWTADGFIAKDWAPVSPVTGAIDAFEWRVPVENLNEPEDLELDQIPEGPREIFLGSIGAAGTTGATIKDVLEMSDSNDTPAQSSENLPVVIDNENENEEAPTKQEASVEAGASVDETAKSETNTTANSDPSDQETRTAWYMKPDPAEKPVTANKDEQAEKVTPAKGNDEDAKTADATADGEKIDPSAHAKEPDSASSDKPMSFEDEKKQPDPIERPVIDDPGIKNDGEPRKKFRLF